MIKKIHSIITLILCVLLISHLILSSLLLTHTIGMIPALKGVSHTLLLLLVFHVLFTLISMLLNHNGDRSKPYMVLNRHCYLQRVSGVLMLVFLHPHFFAFTPPSAQGGVHFVGIPYFISFVVLILLCCLHMMLSIPRALVGLGVVINQKTYSIVEKCSFIFAFIFAIIAISCVTLFSIETNLWGTIL